MRIATTMIMKMTLRFATPEQCVASLWRRAILALALPGMLVGVTACGDVVGSAVIPAGSQGPGTYNTEAGALATYRGAQRVFREAQAVAVLPVGALTDELTYWNVGTSPLDIGATGQPTDERLLPETGAPRDILYAKLHAVRGTARQAIGLLSAYAPGLSSALRGEMYALQAYAELLLAELYCSGVPLSTLDFEGDFTYRPSSTQEEVYAHVVTLFDSALAISSDSPSVMTLAQVGKGRVLTNLGQYTVAAQAVAAVPNVVRIQTPYLWNNEDEQAFKNFTIANDEGVNGFPFVTSEDPRVQVSAAGANPFGIALYTPAQYPMGSDAATAGQLVIASGVEARLIEAEAVLNVNPGDPSWLMILNALRTTCTDVATCPTPAPAGIGEVAGLPPLEDPGLDPLPPGKTSFSVRVDLLFREREYWLFLTGHRQGDLRRLVRNYGRPQATVYPTGPYFGGRGAYGSDVTLPIPESERANPLFHGCLDREA